MSKMKKVISLVLCIAMLAGTFTFLGDLIAPSASAAAGTTNVATYAEIDAQYDQFVYIGVDVIEADGELTDGYVKAGDWLEYRVTVLSDMYVGNTLPHIVYDRDFFDVRVVTSTTPSTSNTFEKADYEGNKKFADGKFMNPNHPVAPQNGEVASYNTLTALPYSNITTQLGNCSIDASVYKNWDLVKTNLGVTSSITNVNFEMKADEWITSWYVRVKEGLADGETGNSFSPDAIWKVDPTTLAINAKAICDVYTSLTSGTYASSKSMSVNGGNIKALLLEDTYHTFTIGEKPAEEEPDEPVKYEAKFVSLDGTEIAKAEYAEGETIAVPEVADLLGWVDSTGKLVEVNTTMGTKAVTYTAVLTTDKFDVKVVLGGGTYDVVPEGATVDGDNLIIKAGLGETVDLAAIALPEKEGYTASWPVETVKVESTRGATVRLTWAVDTYNATFYLDKEAYDAGAEAIATNTFRYGTDMTAAFAQAEIGLAARKPEKKFVGWKNAATGEAVEKTTKFSEDVVLYADWTDYSASLKVWGRDYANGGWKEITTKYADTGATVKINDLKALVTEANYGTSAVQYNVAGSASTFSNETAIRNDFTMAEGNSEIYLYTSTKFDVVFTTPVFDENGYITEETGKENKTVYSQTDDTFLTANVLPTDPAAHTGYKFVGWTDAEGNVYPAGKIVLDYADGTSYEFIAKYEEVEYTIEFIINNAATYKQTVKAEGTFKVGDTITLSEMTYLDENGEETALPEAGKENQEQAEGPYDSLNGYAFKGWKSGAYAASVVDCDITEEITLDPAKLDELTYSDKITIRGIWEGLYYDFVAYYADTYENGAPVYKAMPAVKVQTGASLNDAYAAATETANANLPEGKRFSLWKLEDGSNRPNTMPAYGTEVYATYLGKSLSIYIDYNYGTEDAPVALDVTMSKSNQYSRFLFDGVDVVNDVPAGEAISIDKMIRMSAVSDAVSPGEQYEVVNWKVYYVVNEEDVYNPEKWVEGYSDVEGSTIAKYTLIYQVEWMAHKDFLFRVYNTDGALRSAIDKKFQKHFWYMDKPTDEEGAVALNTLPDRLILLGFIPKLDGFDFDRFFEADMWSNLSIRIDPLTLSKAWLDPSNWGALLEALWNGITTGFGGAL